jgi:hypothetical protein
MLQQLASSSAPSSLDAISPGLAWVVLPSYLLPHRSPCSSTEKNFAIENTRSSYARLRTQRAFRVRFTISDHSATPALSLSRSNGRTNRMWSGRLIGTLPPGQLLLHAPTQHPKVNRIVCPPFAPILNVQTLAGTMSSIPRDRWEQIRAANARRTEQSSSWDALRQRHERARLQASDASDDGAGDRAREQAKFDAMLVEERRKSSSST